MKIKVDCQFEIKHIEMDCEHDTIHAKVNAHLLNRATLNPAQLVIQFPINSGSQSFKAIMDEINSNIGTVFEGGTEEMPF